MSPMVQVFLSLVVICALLHVFAYFAYEANPHRSHGPAAMGGFSAVCGLMSLAAAAICAIWGI
jgi:hypothetical protein